MAWPPASQRRPPDGRARGCGCIEKLARAMMMRRDGGRDDVGVDGNPGVFGNERLCGGAPTRRPAVRNARDMARTSIHDARRYSVFGATIGVHPRRSPPLRFMGLLPLSEDALACELDEVGASSSTRRHLHNMAALERRVAQDERASCLQTRHSAERHLILRVLRPMVPHGSGVQSRGDGVSGQNRTRGSPRAEDSGDTDFGSAREELDR